MINGMACNSAYLVKTSIYIIWLTYVACILVTLVMSPFVRAKSSMSQNPKRNKYAMTYTLNHLAWTILLCWHTKGLLCKELISLKQFLSWTKLAALKSSVGSPSGWWWHQAPSNWAGELVTFHSQSLSSSWMAPVMVRGLIRISDNDDNWAQDGWIRTLGNMKCLLLSLDLPDKRDFLSLTVTPMTLGFSCHVTSYY